MNIDQRQKIVERLSEIATEIKEEPGFFADQELKASFLVVHTAGAAVKFNEEESLAEICAEFCKEKAAEPTA